MLKALFRARLTYAESPVSWDLLGTREDVCARAVPACGVKVRRGCAEGVGATTWVRGGGACRRGWVSSVPLAAERARLRGRTCVDAWAGAASGGSFRAVAPVAWRSGGLRKRS